MANYKLGKCKTDYILGKEIQNGTVYLLDIGLFNVKIIYENKNVLFPKFLLDDYFELLPNNDEIIELISNEFNQYHLILIKDLYEDIICIETIDDHHRVYLKLIKEKFSMDIEWVSIHIRNKVDKKEYEFNTYATPDGIKLIRQKYDEYFKPTDTKKYEGDLLTKPHIHTF